MEIISLPITATVLSIKPAGYFCAPAETATAIAATNKKNLFIINKFQIPRSPWTLFADETLFYPYSDCEDRAILYSILVRDLLDLDVVLLHYPGHLATAVCFGTELTGDHLTIGDRRYTVCDPTYIHADVGQAMPKFKKIPAEVITTGGAPR